MAIEKLSHKILLREGKFELRLIDSASFIVTQDSTLRGGEGFSKLFEFIQGRNSQQKKISMTTPVVQTYQDEVTVAFVMPKSLTKQVPTPMDSRVTVKHVEAKKIVCYRFSGSNYQRMLPKFESMLRSWAKSHHLMLEPTIQIARYNPPIVPGFLRHNELWIDVIE